MLVITRKKKQSIKIGDDTIITIMAVDRGQVRVGIEAPADRKILRSELKDRFNKSGNYNGGTFK